jgi:hypothetical protein
MERVEEEVVVARTGSWAGHSVRHYVDELNCIDILEKGEQNV